MTAPRLNSGLRKFRTLPFIGMLPVVVGCSQINIRQIAYELLRQEDCKLNQLEDFCTRTFASEYFEYERMRQEYIRSRTDLIWRIDQDEATLSDNAETD
jgi:hypothetical protein